MAESYGLIVPLGKTTKIQRGDNAVLSLYSITLTTIRSVTHVYSGERQPLMDYRETVAKEIRPQMYSATYGRKRNVKNHYLDAETGEIHVPSPTLHAARDCINRPVNTEYQRPASSIRVVQWVDRLDSQTYNACKSWSSLILSTTNGLSHCKNTQLQLRVSECCECMEVLGIHAN